MSWPKKIVLLLLVAILFMPGCSADTPARTGSVSVQERLPGRHRISLTVGSHQRSYIAHVPPGLKQNKVLPEDNLSKHPIKFTRLDAASLHA